MTHEKTYKVSGKFKTSDESRLTHRISETVQAFSKKQAKLKAGFQAGFGGQDVQDFVNSRNIKVRQLTRR